MESMSRLAMAVLLVGAVSFSFLSAAAAPKDQTKRSTYQITDDQVVQLKQLLARLRDKKQTPTTKSSVEKPSDQKSVELGKPLDKEHQKSPGSANYKPQARLVSAEDMHARNMDIVEQLKHLDESDTAEILERALAKIEEARNSAEEKEDDGFDSTGDDMGTLNNGKEAELNTKTEHVDSVQLLEALIQQGLTKLDEDSGNRPQSLFQSESRPQPRNYKAPVTDSLYQRYLDFKRADQTGEESHEITEEEKLREKDLQIVESRLMEDIRIANLMGVSVEDLIRDLEERAYIQAHAKRIEELLTMHEQGIDEK